MVRFAEGDVRLEVAQPRRNGNGARRVQQLHGLRAEGGDDKRAAIGKGFALTLTRRDIADATGPEPAPLGLTSIVRGSVRVRGAMWGLACALISSVAYAQAPQVRVGAVPAWVTPSALLAVPDKVDGPLFTRRQDVLVHLGPKQQAQYLGYRVKILQPAALQLGNLQIVWDPAADAPIVHEVTIFRDGQTVEVLQHATFEVLRREDQLEQAQLDGRLTAVLRVPDLRVGDELGVAVTTFSRDPTPNRKESGALVLPQAVAAGRYHLGLSWEAGQAPRVKPTADMAPAMTKGVRAVDFRFDNPPILTPPKDSPPRYAWQRAVEYSEFGDWAEVSRHFAPLFVKASALPAGSAVKQEAARIAAAHARPFDRAAAALKLVQQDVRYIYVGLDGGNLLPATADETWRRRYGDCKGKTTLLLALLAELGVPAEAVLINSTGADDGLDQRLPSVQFFDHVLVRARIDGTAYWLDGTLPPVATPATRAVYPIRWALPLSEPGTGLEAQAWGAPSTPEAIHLFEFDARAGFDKPARIVSTEITRGLPGLLKYLQFSAVTPGQLLEAFRQQGIGDVWQSIDDVKWHYDEKARASILTISGSGTITWEDDDGGGKSLALPGGGFSPPDRRVRGSDQASDAPYYSKPEYDCHVTTVRLPTSTLPQQWSSKASFDQRLFGREYHRAWQLRDGAIRMVRGLRIEQPEIDVVTAQRDNARIPKFDNSMGYIFYNPASQKAAVGGGETTPATYDFDWTADDVPCTDARMATGK